MTRMFKDCKLVYITWIYKAYLELKKTLTSQSLETPSEGNLLNTSEAQEDSLQPKQSLKSVTDIQASWI